MVLLYFTPALRIILGLLFIITSTLKFPNLKGFAVIVASYNVLPKRFVKTAAYTQPAMEFIVGLWILSGKQLFYAAIAGFCLMMMANLFVAKGLLEKKKLKNCGCFGANIKVPLTRKKLAENIVWTLLLVLLAIAASSSLM